MEYINFKRWFNSQRSALLVNGSFDSGAWNKISPLSVFCATFATSLVGMERGIVLHFFCGQHLTPDDDLRGPRGLIRSLIAQLLLYPSTFYPNANFIVRQNVYQACSNHDIAALCYAFELLVMQYPLDTSIFCIIDNVSAFETTDNGWDAKLRCVLDTIKLLTKPSYLGPAVKVLITSPSKCIMATRTLPADCSIWLCAGNQATHPMTRQAIEWQMEILSSPFRAQQSLFSSATLGSAKEEF
jgi:hypothetical protein